MSFGDFRSCLNAGDYNRARFIAHKHGHPDEKEVMNSLLPKLDLTLSWEDMSLTRFMGNLFQLSCEDQLVLSGSFEEIYEVLTPPQKLNLPAKLLAITPIHVVRKITNLLVSSDTMAFTGRLDYHPKKGYRRCLGVLSPKSALYDGNPVIEWMSDALDVDDDTFAYHRNRCMEEPGYRFSTLCTLGFSWPQKLDGRI